MATVKGTWKFNDVLTAPSISIDESVNFSFVASSSGVNTQIEGSFIEVIPQSFYPVDVYFKLETSSVDLSSFGITLPYEFCMYGQLESVGWYTSLYGEGIKTIDFGTEPQTVSAEFYNWLTSNAVEQKTIKARTYRFNDVLTRPDFLEFNVGYDANIPFAAKIVTDTLGTFLAEFYGITLIESGDADNSVFEISTRITSCDRISDAIISAGGNPSDYFPWDMRIYIEYEGNGEWVHNWFDDTGYKALAPIQTITITEDTEVSAEFYEWFTANAVPVMATITYNGSTIADLVPGQTATLKCKGMKMEDDVVVEVAKMGYTQVDKSKVWLSKNFPSDVWSEGEYTYTSSGVNIPVRYLYRTGKADPKEIEIKGTIVDVDGHSVAVTNLMEYYVAGFGMVCGRMEVVYRSELADILYENPVVITFVDLSAYYTDLCKENIVAIYTAMQATLKNYEGQACSEIANAETYVSYWVDTGATTITEAVEAKYLYAGKTCFCCTWYFEDIGYDAGISYAYAGYCTPAKFYFTWE